VRPTQRWPFNQSEGEPAWAQGRECLGGQAESPLNESRWPGYKSQSQGAEAKVNNTGPASKIRLLRSRSPSMPAGSSRLAKIREESATIHCKPLTVAASRVWMSGLATLTTVISRIIMKEPRQASVPNTREVAGALIQCETRWWNG
jgi:hypothetical protein